MNDRFTIDKKLELLQQVRSRYDHDQSDLARREWILYGKTGNAGKYASPADIYDMSGSAQTPEEQPFSTFSLRLLVSVGLFLLLVICDLSGKNFFGLPTSQCFQAISQDYESSITRWVNAASGTISNTVSDTSSHTVSDTTADKAAEASDAGIKP